MRAFREEVRITYLHELGHYLGLEEDEIEARGSILVKHFFLSYNFSKDTFHAHGRKT